MSMSVRRVFVEKKPGFDVEARAILTDLKDNLGIAGLRNVRVVNRYDIAGLSAAEYLLARDNVLFEPPIDVLHEETLALTKGDHVFAVEYLPGQYDQRADSAAQCIQLLTRREPPVIAAAKVMVLRGELSPTDVTKIKGYLINPVEAREAALDKPEILTVQAPEPDAVPTLNGFINMSDSGLAALHREFGLAMSLADLQFCRQYFRDTERRDPTETELRVIDTYWSDHCRHTTFFTSLHNVRIEEGPATRPIQAAWEKYRTIRRELYGETQRDLSLMDVATIGMKELRQQGLLTDLDASEEINAASIRVAAKVNGQPEEWLVMFKNETHNHPTEIEPFGGAATCLGGAIRDPLSGRVYVYQAMRVTGSGDPRTGIAETLPGKLPQRKITTGAAAGYSAYGNQIGLATGQVAEIYDEGYVAKRLEIGAVIGAAPRENVVRAKPQAGDLVVLLGGRTGRDGCGGATGSSKAHTENSLSECGAEVQKGNPPTERKIQRLFRDPTVSRLIKRCNDFGAGGVSVAIGELAAGLEIDLDAVPKKYEGLNGTELAISESQERMALVVDAKDLDTLLQACAVENLEATVVARVTASPRLRMNWRGVWLVDLARDFLDTNGVKQHADVVVAAPEGCRYDRPGLAGDSLTERWLANLGRLNVCSQRGLGERFDGSIGAATVLMPYGGRYQLTPVQGMAAKLPVFGGDTDTATAMTFGCLPEIAKWSPFHGAAYAVVEALAKLTALGADYRKARLTFQEYFEKLGNDPVKWGKPFSALLGALHAQLAFGTPAIGGKDSMSGTFNDLTVPPTLAAFAISVFQPQNALSPEFKLAGDRVVMLPAPVASDGLPDFARLRTNWEKVLELHDGGKIAAAWAVSTGGVAAGVTEMAFGNMIGMRFVKNLDWDRLFQAEHGALILELAHGSSPDELLGGFDYINLGVTQTQPVLSFGAAGEIELDRALEAWIQPLSGIFPDRPVEPAGQPDCFEYRTNRLVRVSPKIARPRVLIPVFPGTNCEYDSAAAFEKAGGSTEILVVRNQSAADIEETIEHLAAKISEAQIVMLPGGFSAGDEPDGSGKFIAAMFRNPRVKEAVHHFLKDRDGLMLGICNGFQALVKLGLVPYGEIVDYGPDSPTLTYNLIGRHVSRYVNTKVASNLSPWLSKVAVGDIHTVPVSHGEGRFIAPAATLQFLAQRGQIATQYVDWQGTPSYRYEANPNGSVAAVEGITSPDGRVFGKMAHSERFGTGVALNITGNKDQKLFAAGVDYFRA